MLVGWSNGFVFLCVFVEEVKVDGIVVWLIDWYGVCGFLVVFL